MPHRHGITSILVFKRQRRYGKQTSIHSNSTNPSSEKLLINCWGRKSVSDPFRRRLNVISRVPVIFTTRKLKTAVPSLKYKIPNHLCSNVVYHITCPGCSASYVGQTTRHVTTRVNEHSRISTPVGEHMTQCVGNTENLMAKIIDRSNDPVKFLTLEALTDSNRLKFLTDSNQRSTEKKNAGRANSQSRFRKTSLLSHQRWLKDIYIFFRSLCAILILFFMFFNFDFILFVHFGLYVYCFSFFSWWWL